jgi:DNA helicase HerA-like ATPase
LYLILIKMSTSSENFSKEIQEGYNFSSPSIVLGCAIFEGTSVPNLQVKAPLRTFNRHGLVAGATGTGKTKTLQKLSEKLSEHGVGVVMLDIKGDFSGISMPGAMNPKIQDRVTIIGDKWDAMGFPVELMSLSEQDGVRLRATVSEFGPVLLSKILGLNDTQESVVAMIFKYCDDNGLPLLDLEDIKKVLQYISGEGKSAIEAQYGMVSTATIGTIQRKIIELETQGASIFFGEKSFEIEDFLRKDSQGRGYVHVIRVNDIQNQPKLFSTFMLQMLAEVYEKMPEKGDSERPELVIFIDEAHLVFNEASKALLSQIETIVKLIRSKGVGIFFCTQNPTDIPESVLSQLGMKIQHALRAFTANDRKAIKMVAENYPETDHYDVDELITQLGIGEAFITVLNERGIPTPLVHTLMSPPQSRMDIITEAEKQSLLQNSALYHKYRDVMNRESAYEILGKKMEAAQVQETTAKTASKPKPDTSSTVADVLKSPMAKRLGTTITREVTRGLLGILKSSVKGMFK